MTTKEPIYYHFTGSTLRGKKGNEMTTLDQQIKELGTWAAGLELSAQDPTTPYWMRLKDAERAEQVRAEQIRLLQERDNEAIGFKNCRTQGCKTRVLGSDYCPRCEEEINGMPYPLANVLLGETFVQYVTRVIRRWTK